MLPIKSSPSSTSHQDAANAARFVAAEQRAARESPPPVARAADAAPHNRDVTVALMMSHFSLQSISFAEDLDVTDDQHSLAPLYEAFQHLVAITGFPAAMLGLSKLGLHLHGTAAGGRAPHYQPNLRVLNVNMRGPSLLAHEWAHGLDHYMTADALHLGWHGNQVFASQLLQIFSTREQHAPERWPIALAMLRILRYLRWGTQPPEQRDAMSDYYRAALNIEMQDGVRMGSLATPTELFAHGFEAFVEDRMSTMGIRNPVLVHGTLADASDPQRKATPYPQGRDRQILNRLYGDLLAGIRGEL